MLAHVDANNFYASCEQLFNPALRGRPVVVLSNNDGAVVARSGEAKALVTEFSRPPGRGLIEACSSRQGCRARPSHFLAHPGEASLKPD